PIRPFNSTITGFESSLTDLSTSLLDVPNITNWPRQSQTAGALNSFCANALRCKQSCCFLGRPCPAARLATVGQSSQLPGLDRNSCPVVPRSDHHHFLCPGVGQPGQLD
ncbi:MAG: hypothetical protein ACE5K7_04515, partial [Phycisphaerae bacterium]